MDKLQEYLSTKKNWESQLYKVIERALSKLASKYQIKEDVIDKELKLIFYKAYNSVGGNKEEFVIRKKVKGNFSATEEILNAVVMDANDDYFDLNNKAIDMVVDNFISPLIKEYELIKKNERTEGKGIEALRKLNEHNRATPKEKITLSEDDRFCEVIHNAKNRIIARGGKANKSQVAIELKIADSTFRDRVNRIMIQKKITWGAI